MVISAYINLGVSMKPYAKTYRCSKDHKTSIGCSLCAERVGLSKKPIRQKAKKDIKEEINNEESNERSSRII